MRVARVLTGCALGACLTACFTFAPAAAPDLREGEVVRVWLSPAASQRISTLGVDLLGPDQPATLSGGWVRRPDGRFAVRVPVAAPRPGSDPIVQEIALDPGEVLRVDRRQLSTARSTLAVAGVVGGGTAAILLIVTGSTGEPHQPGPGGPDDLRIP